MPQDLLKSMKKNVSDTIFVNSKDDIRLKKYQDSLKAYKSMKILRDDERGGDWEDKKGYRWTSKDKQSDNYKARPKSPIQPVKYETPIDKKTEPKVEAKGSKKYFIDDTQVDEKTFNKIAPIKKDNEK
jgi:hypothetical protein